MPAEATSVMTSRWQDSDVPRGDDYDARWKALAAAGQDLHGEANFVMTFAPATVLDAGCGTGRVAIELARRGVDVVGVDLDAGMLDAARRKAPELSWVQADLAGLDLGRQFDLVVLAGNVMIFLRPGTEGAVVERLSQHVVTGGHLICGFQLGRALTLAEFDRAADAAGFDLVVRYATWDAAPFPEDQSRATYAVSVHQRREERSERTNAVDSLSPKLATAENPERPG